eukprot:scaffold72669_cov69-Phaeocystis_antarctica.AAC.5
MRRPRSASRGSRPCAGGPRRSPSAAPRLRRSRCAPPCAPPPAGSPAPRDRARPQVASAACTRGTGRPSAGPHGRMGSGTSAPPGSAARTPRTARGRKGRCARLHTGLCHGHEASGDLGRQRGRGGSQPGHGSYLISASNL